VIPEPIYQRTPPPEICCGYGVSRRVFQALAKS
jgi:hypothetical protein